MVRTHGKTATFYYVILFCVVFMERWCCFLSTYCFVAIFLFFFNGWWQVFPVRLFTTNELPICHGPWIINVFLHYFLHCHSNIRPGDGGGGSKLQQVVFHPDNNTTTISSMILNLMKRRRIPICRTPDHLYICGFHPTGELVLLLWEILPITACLMHYYQLMTVLWSLG